MPKARTAPTLPPRVEPDDLAPPLGEVDESCAGIPLDAWKRGDPCDGLKVAVASAAEHPDVAFMAYCHEKEPKRELFGRYDDMQIKAGRAYAAERFPHLKVRVRTITLPYRGAGSDVTVIYADVDRRKAAGQ
jgi:hypothetical protein